ncbi:MAG: hypothetical protein QXX17_06945 [Conexivisphaerales archaeon]
MSFINPFNMQDNAELPLLGLRVLEVGKSKILYGDKIPSLTGQTV